VVAGNSGTMAGNTSTGTTTSLPLSRRFKSRVLAELHLTNNSQPHE